MQDGIAKGLFFLVIIIAGIIALGTVAVWLAPFIAIAAIVYGLDILLTDKNKR